MAHASPQSGARWFARASALLLLVSLLLPFAQPAFAASVAETVRACCRNHGRHTCMGHMPAQATPDASTASLAPGTLPELTQKCCCPPAVASSIHLAPFLSGPAASSDLPRTYAAIAMAAVPVAGQTLDASANPKRGPPYPFSIA